ncbi:DUF4136 domain-containing protein [Agarivorans litoreus]|uniref:DUF4136 domain-containing protein n=1 Tax=Agarivorans litoreus TaxID=1510455 RepID=UPI001C7D5E45|nr:DUF4136 domain-containing protein [Agarivorans litoreus]
MRLKMLLFLFLPLLFACVSAEQAEAPKTRFVTVVTGDTESLESSSGRYAWHPSVGKTYLDKAEDEALLLTELRKSITKVMTEKGYTQVSLEQQPDFLIGVAAALESQMSDQQILERAGMMAGMSSNSLDPKLYQKGSIMVALFQTEDTSPFWRVLGQGMAPIKVPLSERKQRIESAIEGLLQYIPRR